MGLLSHSDAHYPIWAIDFQRHIMPQVVYIVGLVVLAKGGFPIRQQLLSYIGQTGDLIEVILEASKA